MSARPARRRGRSSGPTLTTIWWRDIPVQVTATDPRRDGTDAVRAKLPARFGHAVDRAAMAAGLAGSDTYLEQWDRRPRPCGPDLEAAVAAEVERLTTAHPRDVLAALVANAGRRPPTDPDEAAERRDRDRREDASSPSPDQAVRPSEPIHEVPT